MRPAFLVVASNVIAFALGGVVALWISLPRLPAPASPAVAVPPANAALGAPEPGGAPSEKLVSERAATPTAAPPQATAAPPPVVPSPATVVQAEPPPATPGPTAGSASASEAIPAAGAATAKDPAPGAYVLRFGAFAEAANAASMQAELKRHGYLADVVPASGGGRALHVVQLGGFSDRVAAAEAASALQRDTGIDPLVLRATRQ